MNFKNVILSLALVFTIGCGKSCSNQDEKNGDTTSNPSTTGDKAPEQGSVDLFSFVSQDSNLFIQIDYTKLSTSPFFSDLSKKAKEGFLKKYPSSPYYVENINKILITGKLEMGKEPEDSMVGFLTGKLDNIEEFFGFIKSSKGTEIAFLEEYEGYKIYQEKDQTSTFAFKPNFVIFGEKINLVKSAIDVSKGKQPSLAKNEAAIKLLDTVKGKMLSVVGSDLSSLATEVGSQAPAPFNELQQARDLALSFDSGSSGELLLDGAITTPSAEGAKKLVDTVNAFLTIIKANPDALNKEKPYVSKILDSIKAEAQGSKLALHIILPKEMIDDLSKEVMDEILEKQGETPAPSVPPVSTTPSSPAPATSEDRAPVAPE